MILTNVTHSSHPHSTPLEPYDIFFTKSVVQIQDFVLLFFFLNPAKKKDGQMRAMFWQ